MRLPVVITNTNKRGQVTNKWFVKIGTRFRVFGQRDWADGGVEWVNSQLEGKK